ncbi:MAG: hypothetical protein Q8M18_00990 [Bradyrhizobium sp.]|nr:hypothetical protein [Bradyrhizobium sp.]
MKFLGSPAGSGPPVQRAPLGNFPYSPSDVGPSDRGFAFNQSNHPIQSPPKKTASRADFYNCLRADYWLEEQKKNIMEISASSLGLRIFGASFDFRPGDRRYG